MGGLMPLRMILRQPSEAFHARERTHRKAHGFRLTYRKEGGREFYFMDPIMSSVSKGKMRTAEWMRLMLKVSWYNREADKTYNNHGDICNTSDDYSNEMDDFNLVVLAGCCKSVEIRLELSTASIHQADGQSERMISEFGKI
ncbi:hypothetical protein Tco_1043730 [Tanacetum coccineum]|uniref:Uncharacterized protein n=1 Tax=Tanacetum coccineum TaxID=301880 RepID=A0ABQ5GNI4_9ASTR